MTTFIEQLYKDLDAYCVEHFAEEQRKHLGASIIGHPCKRYAWSVFRWLKQEKFDGRMLRLFNRGHLEEERFAKFLKGIGFTVYLFHPEQPNNEQFHISAHEGHYGGGLDAILYRIDVNYLLGEFKTHNAKSFAKLVKEGVRKAKPQHYKQMCAYGKDYNLAQALYCAVNKDTDEIHFELVDLDFAQGVALERKAGDIIYSQVPPPKISASPAFFDCKYCVFTGICHANEAPEKNCRSCIAAKPIENKQWRCTKFDFILKDHLIATGCNDYQRIV